MGLDWMDDGSRGMNWNGMMMWLCMVLERSNMACAAYILRFVITVTISSFIILLEIFFFLQPLKPGEESICMYVLYAVTGRLDIRYFNLRSCIFIKFIHS